MKRQGLQSKLSFGNHVDKLATLLKEKNKNYGSAFERSANILKILFPDGIKVEQYKDFCLLVRICDKMCRISNGHITDSFEDIAGYGIIGSYQ